MTGPTAQPAISHPDLARFRTRGRLAVCAAGEGEAPWVFGILATIKAGTEARRRTGRGDRAPCSVGSGSPLHVHRSEDDGFVTEGELAVSVSGQVVTAAAGSFIFGPRDIPHTFTVTSGQARFLLVTQPAGFENFMRDLAEPARHLTIPPAAAAPPDVARLTAVAAGYGVEILGPPGIPL